MSRLVNPFISKALMSLVPSCWRASPPGRTLPLPELIQIPREEEDRGAKGSVDSGFTTSMMTCGADPNSGGGGIIRCGTIEKTSRPDSTTNTITHDSMTSLLEPATLAVIATDPSITVPRDPMAIPPSLDASPMQLNVSAVSREEEEEEEEVKEVEEEEEEKEGEEGEK